MDKNKALRIMNPVLFLAFVVQVITILIMLLRIKVPHAHLVFEVHEYNGLLIAALVAAHITLNWGWVKANFFKKR